jgi:Amt family ammonium transporter
MNTNTAGLAGGIMVMLLSYIMYKKFDITMILNGALGGLVAITAGADVVGIYAPIIIGGIGGILVFYFVMFFDKLQIDDPVGALSVHLVNGIWGTIAVALFSDYSLLAQLKGIVVVAILSFSISYVVIYIINKFSPFRVDEELEVEGLDSEECGIEAYPEFKKSF